MWTRVNRDRKCIGEAVISPPNDAGGKRLPGTRFSASSRQAIFGRLSFVLIFPLVLMLSFLGAPRLVYSYRTAHFAAMYCLTLATMAAFKDWSFIKLFWRLTGFVSIVGFTRAVFRHHPAINFFDWIADMGGILGALTPSVVQRYRDSFGARKS